MKTNKTNLASSSPWKMWIELQHSNSKNQSNQSNQPNQSIKLTINKQSTSGQFLIIMVINFSVNFNIIVIHL